MMRISGISQQCDILADTLRHYERIGADHEASPAQMALARLLARKPWIMTIPSTRKLNYLDEIAVAMAKIEVVGYRY
jgi:aryl-alcohol dehydrogenase-like predicted oxidoreductase